MHKDLGSKEKGMSTSEGGSGWHKVKWIQDNQQVRSLVGVKGLSQSVWVLYESTIDWAVYKHQKIISHSSGGWGVQDQGISVQRGTFSQFIDGHLLPSHMGEGVREISGSLL